MLRLSKRQWLERTFILESGWGDYELNTELLKNMKEYWF